jgi:hypothetical protein
MGFLLYTFEEPHKCECLKNDEASSCGIKTPAKGKKWLNGII